MIDQVTPSRRESDDFFMADGAAMVEARPGQVPEGAWDMLPGIFLTFVSFYPRMPNAVNVAAEWLSEVYVSGVLDGRVLTDFDEQVSRFADAIFSLEHVMGGRVSIAAVEQLLSRLSTPPGETRQVIQMIGTVNGDIRTTNIHGSGNVVASDGGAAAGPGGAAAVGGSAATAQGGDAKVKHMSTIGGIAKRARASRWVVAFGVIALVATVAATILVAHNIEDIGIASYALAVVAVLVGVVPLFRREG